MSGRRWSPDGRTNKTSKTTDRLPSLEKHSVQNVQHPILTQQILRGTVTTFRRQRASGRRLSEEDRGETAEVASELVEAAGEEGKRDEEDQGDRTQG